MERAFYFLIQALYFLSHLKPIGQSVSKEQSPCVFILGRTLSVLLGLFVRVPYSSTVFMHSPDVFNGGFTHFSPYPQLKSDVQAEVFTDMESRTTKNIINIIFFIMTSFDEGLKCYGKFAFLILPSLSV